MRRPHSLPGAGVGLSQYPCLIYSRKQDLSPVKMMGLRAAAGLTVSVVCKDSLLSKIPGKQKQNSNKTDWYW